MSRYFVRVYRKYPKEGFVSVEFDAEDDKHAQQLYDTFQDLFEENRNFELTNLTEKRKIVEF